MDDISVDLDSLCRKDLEYYTANVIPEIEKKLTAIAATLKRGQKKPFQVKAPHFKEISMLMPEDIIPMIVENFNTAQGVSLSLIRMSYDGKVIKDNSFYMNFTVICKTSIIWG